MSLVSLTSSTHASQAIDDLTSYLAKHHTFRFLRQKNGTLADHQEFWVGLVEGALVSGILDRSRPLLAGSLQDP